MASAPAPAIEQILTEEGRRRYRALVGGPTDRAREEGRTNDVDWLTDEPARIDYLDRRPLADVFADRLEKVREQSEASFLVHLDGPWGSGKTTMLQYLRERMLSRGWLVVDFNAWRQSSIGPSWWSLLVALRQAVWALKTRKADGHTSRWRAGTWWLADFAQRVMQAGSPYFVAFLLLALITVGLLIVVFRSGLGWTVFGPFATAATAVLALAVTLWGAAFVFAKFVVWGSSTSARIYEQSTANPMDALSRYFGWLISRTQRPVAFFVDDLDRCSTAYVVQLLEAVQTIVRDAPRVRGADLSRKLGPYFVVAADGRWIRCSYETEYGTFAGSAGEPGRPLGYLFLAKIFQLTVPVPFVSAQQQGLYFTHLLKADGSTGVDREEVERTREQVRASFTEADIVEAVKQASPSTRRVLASEVLGRFNAPAVESQTEHVLERFASLLEPNPRAMKRFINAWAIARSVLYVQDRLPALEPLALWTIIQSRWPLLGDYLALHADDLQWVGNSKPPADLRADIRQLLSAPEIVEVINWHDGGPLTPDLVRECSGNDLHRTPQEAQSS